MSGPVPEYLHIRPGLVMQIRSHYHSIEYTFIHIKPSCLLSSLGLNHLFRSRSITPQNAFSLHRHLRDPPNSCGGPRKSSVAPPRPSSESQQLAPPTTRSRAKRHRLHLRRRPAAYWGLPSHWRLLAYGCHGRRPRWNPKEGDTTGPCC